MGCFDDPAYRARLDPAEYERQRLAHYSASTIETVGGHALRYVNSRFGRLVHVGQTDKAFATIGAAREYANANPAEQGS